jgi:hypothetical protein
MVALARLVLIHISTVEVVSFSNGFYNMNHGRGAICRVAELKKKKKNDRGQWELIWGVTLVTGHPDVANSGCSDTSMTISANKTE